MKQLSAIIIMLSIAVAGMAAKKKPPKYFMNKKGGFLGLSNTNYYLAEIRGDSLQLWYSHDDFKAGGYYESFKTETILLKGGKGEHFTIKRVGKSRIIGKEITLKSVTRLNEYYLLRNSITSRTGHVGLDYYDSVKKILQVEGSNWYQPKLTNEDSLVQLFEYTNCDEFENRYRQYLQSTLPLAWKELADKKKMYEEMLEHKFTLDSLSFRNFMFDYHSGIYDRKILYEYIIQKPELFFIRISLNAIFEQICCYDDCFTKEEKNTMYCALKPLRYLNPNKLWMFERRGDLKCQ